MAITLTLAAATVTLSDRLHWSDEYSWSPVEQSIEFTTTGALIVDVGAKQAGREITLEGVATEAWITRAQCDQLKTWAALPGAEMTLLLRGVERTVIFDQARGAFEAQPIWPLQDGEEHAEQLYRPTLRFLET